MKKRFLPFSLLLVIMILGQSVTIADNGGHYVPRTQGTASAEQFMSEMRVNQHTGLIDPAWMIKAAQSQTQRDASDNPLYWLSMGPDNMGGQTTAVLYDNRVNPNTGGPNGVVYIGSKGGGVYKSYNYGITWHQVGETDLMVSCMVQDADGTIYVGTGDGGAAVSYNGLADANYSNSFVGSGILKIVNDELSVIPSTTPSTNEVTEWSFINDITILGNTLLAATDNGLKASNDKGATWTTILEGGCDEVKTTADNQLVVSCDGKIYIGTLDNLVCHSDEYIQYGEDGVTIIALPTAAGLLDIATAPSDANTIYASAINTSGRHTGIYVSYDKGATWAVALPTTTSTQGHDPYASMGLYNHGLMVDPSDAGILYIMGYNLWKLQRSESGVGYYMTSQITSGTNTTYYSSSYLHVGLHTMAFNPNNANECYVGTDGGVYKATIKNGTFTFSNCNRNYITTRMTNVAISGSRKRVIASGLDHGIVLMNGVDGTDTDGHGNWINPSGYNYGMFDDAYHGGPCAISSINPQILFVTSKNGSLNRTETAGEDWVSTNFTSAGSPYSISLAEIFRTPILLYENFNDANNPETVSYKNTTDAVLPAGTTITCMSQNNYPFSYTLASPLAVNDSIEIHDPISAKLYVTTTNEVYVTRIPLIFAKETQWYEISKRSLGFEGQPLCMAISADGDNLFIGTKAGKVYRLSNLNTVVDDNTGLNTSDDFQVTTQLIFESTQCVTSVAVNPKDSNKVIVTLGNYGNNDYVYYTTNALADEPTFVSKQANLPKMPVYSSVIEMTTGHVLLGTERGVYRAVDINSANWVADTKMLGAVPVMEMKQQILSQEDRYVVLASPEDTIVEFYPGVKNTGIVYAATYGRGVFRCENYRLNSGEDVPEIPAVAAEATVSIYPNPAYSQATARFEAEGNATVSYQVFDLTGRLVMSRDLGRLGQGSYDIEINTGDLGSGSYILRVSEGVRTATAKFLVY